MDKTESQVKCTVLVEGGVLRIKNIEELAERLAAKCILRSFYNLKEAWAQILLKKMESFSLKDKPR